jgi:hypothetical protein
MKALLALVVSLSLMAGCQAQFADEYRVGIDPTLSDTYQEQILLAVEEWQTALGPHQVTLTVTYEKCSRNDGQKLICIHQATDEWFNVNDHGTGHVGVTVGVQDWTASSDIYFKTSAFVNNTPFLHQAALHEIGHGLGLIHTTLLSPVPPGHHIMDPGSGSATTYITCEDVQQFLSYRSYQGFITADKCEDPKEPLITNITVQTGPWD